MFKKYGVLLLGLIMVFSLVLSACGSDDAEEVVTTPETDNGDATKDEPESSDDVTLTVLGWKNEGANLAFETLHEKFEADNPGVTIEYITTAPDEPYRTMRQNRVSAGEVDIWAESNGFILAPEDWSPGAADPSWKQFIDDGRVADLTGQAFLSNWNESMIQDAVTYNDKVYGLNLGSVAFTGFYYNKTILADNGIEVPQTWDELIAAFDTLEAAGIDSLAFAGADIWPYNLAVQGLQATILEDQLSVVKGLWDGSIQFTDDKIVEVYEKAQILQERAIPASSQLGYGDLPGLFATGQVAMVGDGIWRAAEISAANPDIDFGYFPIPGNDDASKNQNIAGKYDMTLMIAEDAPNKEIALKYFEFLSDPANYTEFVNTAGFMPTQDVEVSNPLINEVSSQYGFLNAWDQLFINRPDAGEYVVNSSIHAEFLAPWGPDATPADVSAKAQADWDAAAQ